MTREPGPELDAEVAELLGRDTTDFEIHREFGYGKWVADPNFNGDEFWQWSPSTRIAAAWEVIAVVRTWDETSQVRFWAHLRSAIAKRRGTALPETCEVLLLLEPVDICVAALETKGTDE